MRFDVILHGDVDSVDNFDLRLAKLAELINLDVNFIGPLLGAKESIVSSNLEFPDARTQMAKIRDLGFKAEVRPTKSKEKSEITSEDATDSEVTRESNASLVLNQNRASFKAPSDMPEGWSHKSKNTEVDADGNEIEELELANDGDSYSSYNWSRDTKDDEVVKFDDDLVIKKGR